MTIPLSVEKIMNFPVPSNCFVISCGKEKCIVVDPACGKGEILEKYFSSNVISPEYIILTHEHFDHISSVDYLRDKYHSSVIASVSCSESIQDAKRNLSLFYDQTGFICRPADILINEDSLTFFWNEYLLQFWLTTGHSEGGLCFSIGHNLFTGDTLMQQYKPVVKLPGGNKKKLINSIIGLRNNYSNDTQVYPGHGEIFRLGDVNEMIIE